jgi:hypothetical protein
MTKRSGDYYSSLYILQGVGLNSPLYETTPRSAGIGTDNAIAATGVELAVAIAIPDPGTLVTTISFVVGATAAGSPTAGYVVLRDSTGAKLVQSADFGSTARAANTAYNIAVTTPYLVTSPGLYYIGISFTASTVPTLRGITNGNAAVNGALGLSMPILAQSHGSAVGATAPATVATPTTVATIPWLAVS